MPIVQTARDGTLSDIGPKLAAYQHPVYAAYLPIWKQLAHVREGAGGFLDGTYLVAHPREWKDYTAENPQIPTKKLLARRRLAAYENFASTIVEAKQSALFRESPVRRLDGVAGDTDPAGTIKAWWDGVDDDDDIGSQLKVIWDAVATFGHVYLYVERRPVKAGSLADAPEPYLCAYTPLDVPDWMVDDRGALRAVKFLEPTPRVRWDQPVEVGAYQYRIVDETSWTLYGSDGRAKAGGAHGMGRLPVVVLYAQRRPITPGIGQSVLHDPRLHIDLFNLLSELRELLRSQTFSILNVPLGSGTEAMSVETARGLLDHQVGTENVLFSGLSAGFISADATNVSVYQEEISRRLRTIYRLAGVSWEADTRGVEAEGSLSIKREDMNQRLSAYADELEGAEYQIADLWYRARYGADLGPRRMKDDRVTIQYPDTFDVSPFDVVLRQAQAALSLDMPDEFTRELKKSLVSKFLPGIGPADAQAINDAIDAQETPEPAAFGLPALGTPEMPKDEADDEKTPEQIA